MNLTPCGKHKSVHFQKQPLIEFKNRVKFESYLSDIKNRNYRVTFTKFRLSDHCLMIEKGDINAQKSPENNVSVLFALRKSKMKATFSCNVFYIYDNRNELFMAAETEGPNFTNFHTRTIYFSNVTRKQSTKL